MVNLCQLVSLFIDYVVFHTKLSYLYSEDDETIGKLSWIGTGDEALTLKFECNRVKEFKLL